MHTQQKHYDSHAQDTTTKSEVLNDLENLSRELAVFTSGATSGALSAAQGRWQKDPTGVVLEAASAAGTGVAFAFIAEAAPLVAAGIGTVATANYLWSTLNPATHQVRNRSLAAAWTGTWNYHDPQHLNYYKQKVAKQTGNELFDFALGTGFGTAAFCTTDLHPAGLLLTDFQPPPATTAINASMKRLQLGDSLASPMRQFLDGNSHAFERGRLTLTPCTALKYESARHHPRLEAYPPLAEYITNAKR